MRQAHRAAAFVTVAAAALTFGAAAARAEYVDRQEKKFTVSGRPEVVLSTFDGSITVRPGGNGEVAVSIEKHASSKDAADRMEVHAEQTGNHIVVEVKEPGGHSWNWGWNMSRTAKLVVTVPAASDVHAQSGDGAIDVERISGTVEMNSGDGSIHGRELSGTLRVRTGDGSITLDQVSGSLDVNTGDGTVKIDGKLTSVHARSGDGSITIRATAGSSAEGDWDITTGDGSIVLELPDNFGGELDAHTGDGHVNLENLTLSTVTGKISRNDIRGRLGAGGKSVHVRTGDGSITLRKS
jgi:DUF4097 and DUF4098 domain-containing protein YvlB